MYRAQNASIWPKVAGFILVPGLASAAAAALTPHFIKETDSKESKLRTAALVGGVLHALGAAGSWYGSENLQGVTPQAFLRGGMWSELFSTVLFPGSVYINEKLDDPFGKGISHTVATVSGTALGGRSNIDAMVNLLSGGMMKRIENENQHAQFAR